MPKWVALAGYLNARGRDPAGFGIAGRVQINASDLEGSARKAVAWKALDITHLSAITMNAGLGDPSNHLRLAPSSALGRAYYRTNYYTVTHPPQIWTPGRRVVEVSNRNVQNRHFWTRGLRVRDREAPGSNPGPPTNFSAACPLRPGQ